MAYPKINTYSSALTFQFEEYEGNKITRILKSLTILKECLFNHIKRRIFSNRIMAYPCTQAEHWENNIEEKTLKFKHTQHIL